MTQTSTPSRPLPTELLYPQAIRTEQARRHLRTFTAQAWHILEPSTPFVPGWHLDCISEHLEAVTRGEIRDLVINIPPRHAKSLSVSVFWPCWEWLQHPERRWLFASYAQTLSIRDSLKCRRLIESRWYQQRWGHVYQLAPDQNMKTRFDNSATGYRIATSVGGVGTGEGGSRIVVDDPHNIVEAESEPMRSAVLTWWDEAMSTRGDDPQTAARVIVMQRTHESDLSGHVLERGGYHHLCLPARYEPRVQISAARPRPEHPEPEPHDTCAIYQDPRAREGDLLWPARFGLAELQRLEQDLGTYGAAGQLQQRPAPREGALFHSEWFRPLPAEFEQMRPKLTLCTYIDLAFSERASADYTAALTVGIDAAQNVYVLHVWRERVEERSLPVALADLLAELRPAIAGVEEGAFRQAATKDLARLTMVALAGRHAVGLLPVKVTTDKVFRAQLPAARAKVGMVFADRLAPWWPAFEAELLKFPVGAHDDQVDALSGAVQLAIESASQVRPRIKSTPYALGVAARAGGHAYDPFEGVQ